MGSAGSERDFAGVWKAKPFSLGNISGALGVNDKNSRKIVFRAGRSGETRGKKNRQNAFIRCPIYPLPGCLLLFSHQMGTVGEKEQWQQSRAGKTEPRECDGFELGEGERGRGES